MPRDPYPNFPISFVIVKTSKGLEAPRVGSKVHFAERRLRDTVDFWIEPWGKGDGRRFRAQVNRRPSSVVGDWDDEHTFEISFRSDGSGYHLDCEIRTDHQYMTTGTWTADEDGPDR